jgi:3-oxoacyl-[acyl-carrier-protein] synthase II
MKKRVVITGMSGITPIGNNWQEISAKINNKKTGIKTINEWKQIEGLNTSLAAPITNFTIPQHYARKQIRSMGRVAQLAVVATEQALKQAGLLATPNILNTGKIGVAYGSCTGSMDTLADLSSVGLLNTIKNITAMTYIKSMTHTCAAHISLFFGITGRAIPVTSACTSSSQAIGYAYETIKHGYQDVMVAGGAEELSISQTAVFDTLFATSQKNDSPHLTPKPFDKNRDGLVVGEGAGTIILENLDHALARNANIYAEIIGFGTNCDAQHITQPNISTMQKAIELALQDANIAPTQIGYISAHGTATDSGDIAESQATYNVFGNKTPISSLKSYIGHTLGACGAIEAWVGICMMNDNIFSPTINLETIDNKCAPLDYIIDNNRIINCDYIMSNNFAFGGINTSLVFKKWELQS